MMKRKERKQSEQKARSVIEGIFGCHLVGVDFCYWKAEKGLVVTYEDFKPEWELKDLVQEAIGKEWKALLKREFSTENIMGTMLDIYRANEVAVCHIQDGAMKVSQVKLYVDSIMASRR